jgi:hypothetical protein
MCVLPSEGFESGFKQQRMLLGVLSPNAWIARSRCNRKGGWKLEVDFVVVNGFQVFHQVPSSRKMLY